MPWKTPESLRKAWTSLKKSQEPLKSKRKPNAEAKSPPEAQNERKASKTNIIKRKMCNLFKKRSKSTSSTKTNQKTSQKCKTWKIKIWGQLGFRDLPRSSEIDSEIFRDLPRPSKTHQDRFRDLPRSSETILWLKSVWKKNNIFQTPPPPPLKILHPTLQSSARVKTSSMCSGISIVST